MDDEPAPARGAPTATKTAAQQESDDLKAENTRLRKQADDNAADAKFWSDRAKNRSAASARPAPDDDEPARRPPATEPAITERPEELIDDLNKKGLQALKDRGFISKDELAQALEDVRATTSAEISDARSEAVFSGRLEAEFPEMMEDSARVGKGLAPKSELFLKAGEIYRELVDMDPSLKNSRGLLLIAARQAKAAIEAKGGKGGKGGEADDDDLPPSQRRTSEADAQTARRQKIDRQTPTRSREAEDDGAGHHSPEASEVMKRLKVTPEDYNKHRDAKGGSARNGRR